MRHAPSKSTSPTRPRCSLHTGKCTVSVEARLNQPQPDFTKMLGLHPQACPLAIEAQGDGGCPPSTPARRPLTRVQAGRAPCLPAAPPRGPARLLPLISVFLYPDCPGPSTNQRPCVLPSLQQPLQARSLWSVRPPMPGQIGLPGPVTATDLPGEAWGRPACCFQPKAKPLELGGGYGEVALPSLGPAAPSQGWQPHAPRFRELLRLPWTPPFPSSHAKLPGEQVHLEASPSTQEPLAKGTTLPSGQSVPLGASPSPCSLCPRARWVGNTQESYLAMQPRP